MDKVLAHSNADINALTFEMAQRDFRWQPYLSQRGINPTELSAYSLPCSQSPETGEIREVIKTIGNCPYIPGSTIKGAIWTMLLSDLIKNEKNKRILNNSSAHLNREIDNGPPPRRKQEYPAKQIEESVFGRDPNRDLLRALQVSDTEPLKSDALAIEMAWTVTLNQSNELVQKIDKGREYKNYVEVIQRNRRCGRKY